LEVWHFRVDLLSSSVPQMAYLKASNSEGGDSLGAMIGLSGDGKMLVAAAVDEDVMTKGVNNILEPDGEVNLSAGAAYVWVQGEDG